MLVLIPPSCAEPSASLCSAYCSTSSPVFSPHRFHITQPACSPSLNVPVCFLLCNTFELFDCSQLLHSGSNENPNLNNELTLPLKMAQLYPKYPEMILRFLMFISKTIKMNKIQPLKVYKLDILVLSTCVWPVFLYVLLSKCFPQQFVLAPEHLQGRSIRITSYLTSITNPCTIVALTHSDHHLDSEAGAGGWGWGVNWVQSDNLANASQVINEHYIRWLHHNYKKQGLKSHFKCIIISVDCDINILHFH